MENYRQEAVSFKLLESREFNMKGISNKKFSGICKECDEIFVFCNVKRFLRRKFFKDCLCKSCYNKKYQYTEVWRKKNSEAQLVAQNKPETKKKMAISVSNAWTKERKEKMSEDLKKKYKEDSSYRSMILRNLSWTQNKGSEEFLKNLKKSLGCGGKAGSYKGVRYFSLLELSFILKNEDDGILLENYKLDGIKYKAEDKKERVYWPDFQHNNIIYEIKSNGLFFKRGKERNILKAKAGIRFASQNGLVYRIIFLKCSGFYYNLAKKIHENKE